MPFHTPLEQMGNPHPVKPRPRSVRKAHKRIVAVSRIVECQGGVVPDHAIQHGGCSRHKRLETTEGSFAASRVYEPTPEIVALTEARSTILHHKAKELCSPIVA